MTIDEKKYLGWPLEGISVEPGLFTVNLARHALTVAEAADITNQRVRARLIFIAEKVILSNVQSGAEIVDLKQSSDTQGNVVYVVKFSSDLFIEVTAGGVTDLLF